MTKASVFKIDMIKLKVQLNRMALVKPFYFSLMLFGMIATKFYAEPLRPPSGQMF